MPRWTRPARVLAVAAAVCAVAITAAAPAQSKPTATPAKCAAGTVRGIAFVTGQTGHGIQNLPFTYSSAANLFGYRWNCSGGAVSVKTSSANGGVDVLFAGNPGHVAVVSTTSAVGAASVTKNADGSYHVTIAGDVPHSTFPQRNDVTFVIIVF